jgi:lysozyme
MRPSKKCIDLVKSFEGFKAQAYKCPAGVWTVGYGTTENVHPGDVVNEQEAEELLLNDLMEASKAVDDLVDVQITQNQYDALTSFIYNVGREAFRNSTLLKLMNAGKGVHECGTQFLRWNRAGGKVLPGLSRRRSAEAVLFESKT